MQFLFRLVDPLSVLAIDHEDKTLSAGVVVSPERPYLILTTDIPYIEFYVLVGYGFHVEADWSEIQPSGHKLREVK
jgi:hypothetical protein